MHNVLVWVIVALLSIAFAIFHYKAEYDSEIKTKNRYYKFLELWREMINYFIATLIVYYFISVRWPALDGKAFSSSDFVLGIVFLIAVMGWLPYLVKNVTEGINVIFKKFFDK